MIFRATAPLRLGFAGGGTDVSPYSEDFGGAILNAAISMYAYASIEPRTDNKIVLNAVDRKEWVEFNSADFLEINGRLDLLKGVYNRIIKDFIKSPLSFKLSTYVDAPPGSGLGSSSTLVVAVIGAFCEWLKIPLGEYEIAQLAWEIERKDLNLVGGKQDQYAATFGGFNFMEFGKGNKVIVNPLRMKHEYINELEFNIVLFYTGTSRISAKIIEAQSNNIKTRKEKSIEAMDQLKEQAIMMKEAILKGQLDRVGEILNYGWESKKQTASEISNPKIDEIYRLAINSGATGGKISGAGGGGFMIFFCPGNSRYRVIEELEKFGVEFKRYNFTKFGITSWETKER